MCDKKIQFLQALERGTGDAVLILRKNPGLDVAEQIIDACFANPDHDPQCSGSRGRYLVELISLLKNCKDVESRIVNRFIRTKSQNNSYVQLFEVLKIFAQHGNQKAKHAMYDKFRWLAITGDTDSGEYDIVELDKLDGLYFVTDVKGRIFRHDSNAWDSEAFLNHVKEAILPKVDVWSFVRKAAKTNKNIHAYLANVEKVMKNRRIPAKLKYQQIRKMLDNGEKIPFTWGRKATPQDLLRLAKDTAVEVDRRKLVSCLRIFRWVKYPLNKDILFKHARSKHSDVAKRALSAIELFKGKEIRDLALENFKRNRHIAESIGLLIRNYDQSDDFRFKRYLDNANSENDFHWLAMNVSFVFEKNHSSGIVALSSIIYRKGICAGCRYDLIELLIKRKCLPTWMAKQAIYDSYPETRKIVKAYLKRLPRDQRCI